MKRPIHIAAMVTLISGLVLFFMGSNNRDAERVSSRSNSSNRHASTPSEQQSNKRTFRNARLSLLESLPPGAKVIENKRIPKEIEILLGDGTRITARAASVTATGVNFEAPYTITSPAGFAASAEDGIYSMSRDGSSFKAIGNTTMSGPIKMNEEPNEADMATPSKPSD
jgi:hypothetical protein